MKYERLYNFISPVTGKLPIDRGYILLGDKNGRSFTSPVAIATLNGRVLDQLGAVSESVRI